MSAEFIRLSDIASIQGGYAFKSADFQDEGVAIIKIANIRPPIVSLDGVDRISPEKLIGLERFKLKDSDILMAMTGATVGKVGRYKETEVAYLNQRVARIKSLRGPEFDDFIYAVITQPGFDLLIEGAAAGSAQANISAAGIGAVLIPNLREGEQILIGAIARSLDDCITLLRETNATLEAIAQALFKSWFVDFDPVHAKQQGRAPEGMDAATAALFPDSFEESELGMVPKGWRQTSFFETIQIIGGGTPKTSNPDFWGGTIPWYSVVDAPNESDVFVIETEKKITSKGLSGSSTKLLPKFTTIISARGTVGKLALTACEMAMNQSCYGLRSKNDANFFNYFSTKKLVNSLRQKAHGSVFDTITQETFKGIDVVFPSQEVLIVFENFVEPLLLRALENLRQARSLSELRDTLLPRLISGQLRLPEAQELAQAAVAD